VMSRRRDLAAATDEIERYGKLKPGIAYPRNSIKWLTKQTVAPRSPYLNR
jgi:hypothetical protein